jgi:hypothetical protein
LCILTTLSHLSAWLDTTGSRMLYDLDPSKQVLYVIPAESILGKLPVVPAGDTGTIPRSLRGLKRAYFQDAYCDRGDNSADGCRIWFVNGWALRWSRDM